MKHKLILSILLCFGMLVAQADSITGTYAVCAGASTSMSGSGGATWSSSNTGVATVGSATGLLTGIAAGTAIISYGTAATVVTVNPLPAAITGPTTVCKSTSNTLSNATGGGSWSSSNTGIISIVGSTGVITGNASTTGTVNITYSLPTGCLTTTAATNIDVSSIPAIIGPSNACTKSTFTLSNAIPNGSWSSSNSVDGPINSSGVVGLSSSTFTLTFTYALTAGLSCTTKKGITITYRPDSLYDYYGNSGEICVSASTTITGQLFAYTWSSSDNSVATVIRDPAQDANHRCIVTGISAGTTTISYTNGMCSSTYIVTVNGYPITGNANLCNGGTTTLSHAVTGGTWSSSNILNAKVGSGTGVVTGLAPGTARITYTPPAGCVGTKVVTVSALPSAITGTFSVCVGSSVTLADPTSGGTWSSGSPGTATIGSASGVVTGISSGTATITYTSAAGCSATKVITVNASPAAITGTTGIAAGTTTTLADSDAGGKWSSANTGIATIGSATGLLTGVAPGTATITYAFVGGCFTTKVVTVTLASNSGTASVCAGLTTTLANVTPGGTWSSSNTAIATIGSTTGVVTGIAAGTAMITYAYGSYIATTLVTVNANPAGIGGTLNICVGGTSGLTNAMGGGTWATSNAAIVTVNSSTGLITGISAGTAVISYVVATGCKVTAIVTVNTAPAAITGTLGICVGATTALADAIGGGSWSSSDGYIATVDAATGIVTGISTGTAIISYTLGTGCSAIAVLTVNPVPGAITGTTVIAVGATTALGNPDAGGTWASSNSAIATAGSATGIVTGIAPGTATITYAFATGCMVTTTVTVTVAVITGTASVCVGLTTTLSNTTAGGTWSSSDAAIATVGSASGVVTGIAAGTAVISYIIGGYAATMVITVNSNPAAITGATTMCQHGTTTLSDATPDGIWSSSNTVIATVGSSTGIITGVLSTAILDDTTITITYTLSTGCYTTIDITLNSDGSPINGLQTQGVPNEHDFCVSDSKINTLSSRHTILGPGPQYGWFTSDSTIVKMADTVVTAYNGGRTNGNIRPIAEGTATISYTRGNGCYATYTITVHPFPAPITYSTSSLILCTGEAVTFSDATSGGVWESSNTNVVNWANILTGNAFADNSLPPGVNTAIIRYTTYENATFCRTTVVVTVNECPAPKGISADNDLDLSGAGDQRTTYLFTPNPGTGNIVIRQHIADDKPVSIKVISCTGAVAYNEVLHFRNGSSNINLTHLPSGLYLAELKSEGEETVTSRIVIEK